MNGIKRIVASCVTIALALSILPGCGKKEIPVMRAYDGKNGKMIVLTGDKAKIKNFYDTEFVVLGGGLGGIAAALAICTSGRSVYLVEETDHIAGCFSEPGVCAYPESGLTEKTGTSKSYRAFKTKIMEWYEQNAKTPPEAPVEFKTLTGGLGFESFCFGTDAALEVIDRMLKENVDSGQITILKRHKVAKVTKYSDRIASIQTIDLDGQVVDQITAYGYIDATEHGDLFPLAGIEYVAGGESASDTGEPHASAQADSLAFMKMCSYAGQDGEKGAGTCLALDVREGSANEPGSCAFPVMRETRRILPLTRVTEQDISAESQSGPRARFFKDSVGIGFAPIILTAPDGSTTTIGTKPFQIPLGSLMPANCTNVMAGNANLGTTRVASGAFRCPEIEWTIGEAAGYAMSFYAGYKAPMHDMLKNPEHCKSFQSILVKQYGIPIYWYDDVAPGDSDFVAAQLKPFADLSYNESAKTLHWRNN